MSFRIKVFRAAVHEIDQFLNWMIYERKTLSGAAAWYRAYERTLAQLRRSPNRFPLAPENETADFEVREALFKTRSGKNYRLLFTIAHDEVRVLHVRGPGQDLVPPEKLLPSE